MSDNFDKLVKIMAELRGIGGCPWDREQTPESLRKFLLEETYELLESLSSDEPARVREELGDLLFQVVFLSRIFEEQGEFNIDDVLHDISEKLVRRHPHVFADKNADTPDEVLNIWMNEKRLENRSAKESLLDGIPVPQPSLLRAHQISERVVRVGFEWKNLHAVFCKLHEELKELEEEIKADNLPAMTEEIGDIIFTIVNIARKLNINSELALHQMCNKFDTRWRFMEKEIKKEGKEPSDCNIDELEDLWQLSKGNHGS